MSERVVLEIAKKKLGRLAGFEARCVCILHMTFHVLHVSSLPDQEDFTDRKAM